MATDLDKFFPYDVIGASNGKKQRKKSTENEAATTDRSYVLQGDLDEEDVSFGGQGELPEQKANGDGNNSHGHLEDGQSKSVNNEVLCASM